jgi:DNA replication protein DnaC
LIVDDFGTNEPSDKFMGFFMDLINSRMQWEKRGTVITTNLDEKKLGQFCGDALSDRLNTGTLLIFEGKTRRREIIR